MAKFEGVFEKGYNLQAMHLVLVFFALIVLFLHANGNKTVNSVFNRDNRITKAIISIIAGSILLFHGYRALTVNRHTKRIWVNLWHVLVASVILLVTLKYHDHAFNVAAVLTCLALAFQTRLVLFKMNQENEPVASQ